MLVTTWRDGGPAGSARKLSAATRLALPVLVRGRRTAAGVGAYFDLITDDARLFYGDNFHVGYFRSGSETLAEALDAQTDLVGEMAHLQLRQLVLDAGCGIGAPALRIAARYGCEITGVNISREQVRQGRRLIEERGMSHRVRIVRGDVRALDFPKGSFDAIVCLEAAGDICVTERDKDRLVRDFHRVLRPRWARRLLRFGPTRLPVAAGGPRAEGCPVPQRGRAGHRLARALRSPWLYDRRSRGHHRRHDRDLGPRPRGLRAAQRRGRPPLRPPARPQNPRADRLDSADTRQVRDLPRPLGAQVIATKIEVRRR